VVERVEEVRAELRRQGAHAVGAELVVVASEEEETAPVVSGVDPSRIRR
jgi:hypothetical protein